MAVIFSCACADVTLGLVVVSLALYCYFKHAYKHWRKRGVFHLEPALLVGNMGRMFMQQEGPEHLVRRAYNEAAGHKLVGIFMFHMPLLVVRDLDVVRAVLAKDAQCFLNRYFVPPEKFDPLFARSLVAGKGKKWRHLRIKLTPTFTSGKMKKMFQLIDGCSEQLVACIDKEASEGKAVAVQDVMSRYTMDAIASCAFGVNANALEDPDCEFITTMRKVFEANGWEMLVGVILLFVPWLQTFLSAKWFDRGVNGFVRKTFWDVVGYRKSEGVVRKDFVSLLMQLRDHGEVRADDAKELAEIQQDNKYMNVESSKTDTSDITLEDDDIVAQAFIFIAAGFGTSSSVMNFTLFELAVNPAVQDTLRREIQEVLGRHDNRVTYDAISQMTYLDMVISESLRKYSPLPFLDRECLEDCEIEGTGVTIEKGTVLLVPSHSIHYDPDIYPDPERFDPERFNAENRAKRHNFAYLPFGDGPRKCIGMRFGLLQVKTGLVHVLKKYQVRPCKDTPQHPLEMKFFSGMLAPKKDIVLTFTKLK